MRFYNVEHHNTSISDMKRISTAALFLLLSFYSLSSALLQIFLQPHPSAMVSCHICQVEDKNQLFFSLQCILKIVLFHWNFITKITQSSILKKYKPPKQWSRFSLVFACILRSALSNPKVEKHYVTGYHLLFKTATSCILPSVSWAMQLIWLDWLTLTK